MAFDPTTEENINDLKKLNLIETEELCGCYRGMELQAMSLMHRVGRPSQNILDSLKLFSRDRPELLPDILQAVEWELGEIVKDAAKLLQEAGLAIDKCHTIRGGNQTVVSLLQLRKEKEKARKDREDYAKEWR